MSQAKTYLDDRHVNTWIPNGDGTSDLVTLDLDDLWLETFAEWDGKVDTDTAAAIAQAVITTLEKRR